MATISDVANKANVSIATVSRVLNGKGNVEESTRSRVLKAIDELNYTPNMLGRCLRESKTGIILVSIPTISNPFYADMVRGISDCAINFNYNIMLCCTEGYIERERSYCRLAKTNMVDGMIFMAALITTSELMDLAHCIPIVQCSEYDENAKTPIITTDNIKSAYDAVEYLIRLGHKKIGMLSSKVANSSAKDREKGYYKALKDFDIAYDESLIARCMYDDDSSREGARRLLTEHPDIDAVFCISDVMAFNTIRAAENMGRRVPDDLSVMGFDNIPLSTICSPSISTVNQQSYKLGYYSMKTLYEQSQIEKHLRNNARIYIEHEIIERESTKSR